MVYQLAYASVATRPLDRDALVALLRQSRASNVARRVTGMLLCSDGRFFQLLEGSREDVSDLYARIAEDARHHDVTVLAERHRLLRRFPSWTMAFRDLVAEPVAEPGYHALFDEALERMPWAVEELLRRMGPSGPNGWPTVHRSRVLGLP